MESERKVENFEILEEIKNDEIKPSNQSNGGQMIHRNDKENDNPNKDNTEQIIRRHDEPSELSFEICKSNIKKCCCFIGSMSSSIFLHECIAC